MLYYITIFSHAAAGKGKHMNPSNDLAAIRHTQPTNQKYFHPSIHPAFSSIFVALSRAHLPTSISFLVRALPAQKLWEMRKTDSGIAWIPVYSSGVCLSELLMCIYIRIRTTQLFMYVLSGPTTMCWCSCSLWLPNYAGPLPAQVTYFERERNSCLPQTAVHCKVYKPSLIL